MVNGVKLLYNVSAATVNQIDENLFCLYEQSI